jgi:hypothetical protein
LRWHRSFFEAGCHKQHFMSQKGFDILHNGVPRTYRDHKATAFEAARYAKDRHPRDLIEIVDLSTGQKVIMLPDGRTS